MKISDRLRALDPVPSPRPAPCDNPALEEHILHPDVGGLRGSALDLFRLEGLQGISLKGEYIDLPIERVVCLDVESTGLGTGPGTLPFLVGLAWMEASGRLVVEQMMMGRYDAEPEMLDWLTRTLEERAGLIVTYNGSTYDLPLLESRYILHRRQAPFSRFLHFDCIWPSRSLWKGTVPDGSLGTLERSVFGHIRPRDLPGAMIPSVWTRYVRLGDRGRLDDVLAHNVEDLVTLLAVAGVLASAHRGDKVGGARVQANLGWMLMRKRLPGAALAAFERALALEGEYLPALKGRSVALRRMGRREEERVALRRWISAPGPFDVDPHEALAKNLEHYMKNYKEALVVTETALSICERRTSLESGKATDVCDRLAHRRRRLERRIAARTASLGSGGIHDD